MSIVTVKVDDNLKNDAAGILEELGLDMPTAVRMYLKAVVRENGLPASVRKDSGFSRKSGIPSRARPAEKKGKAPGKTPAVPIPARVAGTDELIALICSVPVGGLTRWSDLEACLSKKSGGEVKIPDRAEWPKINAEGLAIPYWRVVSERGAVRADASCSKELREEMLKAEGHTFRPAGHGIFSGIKVADYKENIVRF